MTDYTPLDYDTEFLEDGRTIEPISFAIVDEDRELYLINRDVDMDAVIRHPWLRANMLPSLPVRLEPGPDPDHPALWSWDTTHPDYHRVVPRAELADQARDFITATPNPELWAWYGAFDHVVLSWLFGPMVKLPAGIPMFTCDLRQEHRRLGEPPLPEQPSGLHNALADARHNRVRRLALAEYAAGAAAHLAEPTAAAAPPAPSPPTVGAPVPWPFHLDDQVRAVHLAGEPACPYDNPAACPREDMIAAILTAHSQWRSYHQPPVTPPTTAPAPAAAYTAGGVTIRPTRYEVSVLDPEHVNYHSHLLIVECKDRYGWGVHNGHQSLDAHCQWGAGTSVYGRDDAWINRYRFDHDTALAIARAAAPHVIVNARYPDGTPAPFPLPGSGA